VAAIRQACCLHLILLPDFSRFETPAAALAGHAGRGETSVTERSASNKGSLGEFRRHEALPLMFLRGLYRDSGHAKFQCLGERD